MLLDPTAAVGSDDKNFKHVRKFCHSYIQRLASSLSLGAILPVVFMVETLDELQQWGIQIRDELAPIPPHKLDMCVEITDFTTAKLISIAFHRENSSRIPEIFFFTFDVFHSKNHHAFVPRSEKKNEKFPIIFSNKMIFLRERFEKSIFIQETSYL